MQIALWPKTTGIVFLIVGLLIANKTHLPKQGVYGFIHRVQGNQMPRIGGHQASEKQAAAVQIVIYTALKAEEVRHKGNIFFLDSLHTICNGASDSLGRFRISLPPGSYSVFLKTNDTWYADETDGGGYVNHVVVQSNIWLPHNFTLRTNSTY